MLGTKRSWTGDGGGCAGQLSAGVILLSAAYHNHHHRLCIFHSVLVETAHQRPNSLIGARLRQVAYDDHMRGTGSSWQKLTCTLPSTGQVAWSASLRIRDVDHRDRGAM